MKFVRSSVIAVKTAPKTVGLTFLEVLEFCREVLSDKPPRTFWVFTAIVIARLGYLSYMAGTILIPARQFIGSFVFAAVVMAIICLVFIVIMMIPWPKGPEER